MNKENSKENAFADSLGSNRTRISLLIVAYLFVQISIPLHYYLWQEDKTDELYAWRMFSDLQMAEKLLTIRWIHEESLPTYEGTPVSLRSHFTESWAFRLRKGPRWLLRKACVHVCKRMVTARSVSYSWYVEKWNGENFTAEESVLCVRDRLRPVLNENN